MRLDLKAPRGPTVGYGPHRTIYLAGQTGIDANLGRSDAISVTRQIAGNGFTHAWDARERLRTRCAKPSDIPVEQSTWFDLVVNLTTAKALGLTMPDKLLVAADEVIE